MHRLNSLPTGVQKALRALQQGKSATLQLPKQQFHQPDNIVGEMCASLLDTQEFTCLEKINLCHNDLGDQSAVPLGQLMKRADGRLDVVSVAHNNMTSVGIRRLVEDAMTSSHVTVLNVVGNPGLGDPTVAELVNGPLASHLQGNRQQRQTKRSQRPTKRPRVDKYSKTTSSSMMLPFHVAIVGGGVGGLALALALHGKGIACNVFERDTCFDQRHQGYGLTLQQGGRAMRALNVADDIAKRAAWSSRHFIFNNDGDVLAFWGPTYTDETKATASTVPLGEDPSFDRIQRMGRHNIHIARQALRGVLFDTCNERLGVDAICWNHKLKHIDVQAASTLSLSTSATSSSSATSSASPCTLHFQSGQPPFHTDLVVGCDGIRSSVREQFVNDSMVYLNLFVMLGIFDVDNDEESLDLLKERVLQMSDGSTRIFIMPFSATQSMWQLTFPSTEEESKSIASGGSESLMSAAMSKCGTWNYPIPNILQRTSPDLISGYPVYDRNPMDIKEDVTKDHLNENTMPSAVPCTLIGDAAHCMSPLKGQGANQALLDAVELSDVIEHVALQRGDDDTVNHQLLTSALRTFENNMTKRTTSKVLSSREACVTLHSRDFLSPEQQSRRKKLISDMPERLSRMQKDGIKASSTPAELDRYAFLIK